VANPVFAIHRKTELLGYLCSSAAELSEIEKQVACRVLGITTEDDISFGFASIALSTEHIHRDQTLRWATGNFGSTKKASGSRFRAFRDSGRDKRRCPEYAISLWHKAARLHG
jgi:hypothetical protein